MSKVDVTLSSLGDGIGAFHDMRYTNDNEGGNGNSTMFEIENTGGNEIFVEMLVSEVDPKTDSVVYSWRDINRGMGVDGIRIHITGSIENSEFLQMLRLILETEKMTEIIKP